MTSLHINLQRPQHRLLLTLLLAAQLMWVSRSTGRLNASRGHPPPLALFSTTHAYTPQHVNQRPPQLPPRAAPGSRCSTSLGRACIATASSHPLAHPPPSWCQPASPRWPPWTQREIGRIVPAAAAAAAKATSRPSAPRTHRCGVGQERGGQDLRRRSFAGPYTRTRAVFANRVLS